MAAKGKAKSKRDSETWAKRVERFHEYLRDGNRGSGWYLAKQRITPSALAKELADHLNATKQQVFCHQGEVILSEPMIDWATRGRAMELAVKLWGMMPVEKKEVSLDIDVKLQNISDAELDARINAALAKDRAAAITVGAGAAEAEAEA